MFYRFIEIIFLMFVRYVNFDLYFFEEIVLVCVYFFIKLFSKVYCREFVWRIYWLGLIKFCFSLVW